MQRLSYFRVIQRRAKPDDESVSLKEENGLPRRPDGPPRNDRGCDGVHSKNDTEHNQDT